MILVDSNIPMYLMEAAHPHNTEAQVILERLIAAGQRLVTDAEVLQEVLHRHTAMEKREAIGPALQVMLDIVDEVIQPPRCAPVTAHDQWWYLGWLRIVL